MAKENSSTVSEEAIAIAFFVAAAISYYLWTQHFQYIADVWRWIRIGELALFYPLSLVWPFGDLEVGGALRYLLDTPGHLIHKNTITAFDSRYPKIINWIPGLLVAAYGFYRLKTQEAIDTNFDEETLLRKFAKSHPWLRRYLTINPVDIAPLYIRGNAEREEFGYGLHPHEFAMLSPPLLLEKVAKKHKGYRQPIYSSENGFDMDLAERAFTAQLRRPFEGLQGLSEAEREVYEILWKRSPVDVSYCRDEIARTIKEILGGKTPSTSNPMGKKIVSYCHAVVLKELQKRKLIKKGAVINAKAILAVPREPRVEAAKILTAHDSLMRLVDRARGDAGDVLKEFTACHVMSLHGFSLTALYQLLIHARTSGVQDSYTLFRHLKGKDRTLWYVLNSCGRQTPFVEAAGVTAHYYQEKEVGRAIRRPVVLEAVDQLRAYMEKDADAVGASVPATSAAKGTAPGMRL